MASVLVCVPHAGGAGAEYRSWRDRFPGWDVKSISLPGRENLFREAFLRSVEAMAEFTLTHVDPRVDEIALYGHSLGAFVAYEAAHLLERRGRVAAALVVAGQHPPRKPKKQIHDLPKESLVDELHKLGGLDPDLIADDELFDLVLPRVRADLEAAHAYAPPPRPLLSCPLLALGGDADNEVSAEDLRAWKAHTRGDFDHRVLPGDHFFVRTRNAEVVEAVRRFVTRSSVYV